MRNLAHTNSRVRYAEGIAVAYEQRETGFTLIAFAGKIIAATTIQRAQFAIKIISQVVPLRALPAVRPGKCWIHTFFDVACLTSWVTDFICA